MFRTISIAFLYLYMFSKKVQIPLVVPLCFMIAFIWQCYSKEINSILFNEMTILRGINLSIEKYSGLFLSTLAFFYLLFKRDLDRYSLYFAYITGILLCVYAAIELSVVYHYFI